MENNVEQLNKNNRLTVIALVKSCFIDIEYQPRFLNVRAVKKMSQRYSKDFAAEINR